VQKTVVALITAAAVLAAAAVASAGDVQTFVAVDSGNPATQSLGRDVSLTIESPGSYVAQTQGVWAGPTYWPANQPSQTATATLNWAVSFRDRATDPATTAAAANTNGWPLDQKYAISIPLYVAGRLVGTLPGYAVITQSGGDQKARFEASLAVPLGVGVQSVVHFSTPSPSADMSASGPYLVNGMILASTWNRGAILQALSLVRVQGNLAPKTISVRLDPQRGQLYGRVVDPFFNPLVGAAIVEEQWSGTAWRKVNATHTTATGNYRVAAARGRLRTVVVNGATRLASAAIER
jgi:hypothetical protein